MEKEFYTLTYSHLTYEEFVMLKRICDAALNVKVVATSSCVCAPKEVKSND